LTFHSCFGDYQCAKLLVPLDYYHDTYPNETVSIAITKLPAKVSVDDPHYGGPILINPGGPGGAGASFAAQFGQTLQAVVDAESSPNIKSADKKYYDIIGFDPRGIGYTTPQAVCMDDPAAAWSWTLRENTEGILGSSDAALGRLWSMTHAWGFSCKEAMDAKEGPDIKQYMTTALVARDMLEIVERHATWVAAKLAQMKLDKSRCHPQHKPDTALYKPEEANLNYWGFSYGTYIGSTFGSMFPDRVGRVILDGVVSTYDYNHGLGNGSLTDNKKAVDSFYTYCVGSGPEICPLATSNSTISDVKDRVEKIIKSIYHAPLAINSASGPDIITYSDVRGLLFQATYMPQVYFPRAAAGLAAIEVGHGAFLDQLKDEYHDHHIYSCPINASEPFFDVSESVSTWAVLCSDGIDVRHETMDEFDAHWKVMEDVAPDSGAVWAMGRMRCTAWQIEAAYKFEGEFGGNTSNPILFLSNTADPVTPLRSGRIMHKLFANSGLLVSDNAGHSSLAQPNLCMLQKIKKYFQTGELPMENTLCVPPQSPYSLNSTDPKSPFYDPSLEGMNVEEAIGTQDAGRADVGLQALGWELSTKIAGGDWLSLGKVLVGKTHGRKMLQMELEDEWQMW
jgi:pimeloyl-ACP methyl ester carboxylesterase